MVITIDARMINMSGIGRYLRSLLPGLLSCSGNLYYLMGKPEELNDFLVSKNVKIIEVHSKIYHPVEHLELRKKIPQCDIYFSPHFITTYFKIPAKKRITTIHDLFHLSEQADFSFLKKLYLKFLYKNALKRSDSIITVSRFSKKELNKYFPRSETKVKVIHNSLDRDTFQFSSENMYPDKKYILYVGNIKPHKNIIRLIQAYNQMKHTDVKLFIVGDRDGFINGIDKFDDLVSHNKNIIFTGRISDSQLISLYSHAEFLSFPSLYEGFGYPPLEAMACGTAVVASSIDVVKEVCGDAVLYFDPESIDDMCQKMSELLENKDLKNDLIRKGENLSSRFTKTIFTDKHLEVFYE